MKPLARAAFLVAALAAGISRPARGQISPGPLAAPHARLDGNLQCASCHGSGGTAAMTGQCLACHKEVAWLAQRRLGLHGTDARGACATCHPDHAGRNFEMITWTEGSADRFDHRRAGWLLEGRHASTKCADCHMAKYRRSPAAALSPQSRADAGWIGLDRACATCHDDAHRGALGGTCLDCHDTRDWKPAPRFDHARTDYPLTGKHLDAKCDACHLAPALARAVDAAGQRIPVYEPVPHRECSDCHADPHAGALGAGCASCHETTGFSRIARGAFDHDRTRYPLRGRHASVACDRCHNFATPSGKRPSFATCGACHADAHGGTATLAGLPADCSACHDLSGFRPAVFTLAQHQRTRYRLEGRHQGVGCGGCHVKNPPRSAKVSLGTSGVLMRPAFARCRDCHADDHAGQLTSRSDQGECSACHAVTGWTPSTFSVADHGRLRLPLGGRHAETACADCHGSTRKGLPPLPASAALGKAGVLLRLREITCPACHVDPHDGRFAARGAKPAARGCESCHDASRFRPSTIDVAAHASYAFALEGAHRAVPCAACHPEIRRQAARSTLVAAGAESAHATFTVADITCEGCHANPHGDQFAGRGGCERCHGLDAFRPAARFDHDRATQFSLAGAHQNVPCASCHVPRPGPAGRPLVRYGAASSRCESCHQDGGKRS